MKVALDHFHGRVHESPHWIFWQQQKYGTYIKVRFCFCWTLISGLIWVGNIGLNQQYLDICTFSNSGFEGFQYGSPFSAFNKGKCQGEFENYRNCKGFWNSVQLARQKEVHTSQNQIWSSQMRTLLAVIQWVTPCTDAMTAWVGPTEFARLKRYIEFKRIQNFNKGLNGLIPLGEGMPLYRPNCKKWPTSPKGLNGLVPLGEGRPYTDLIVKSGRRWCNDNASLIQIY